MSRYTAIPKLEDGKFDKEGVRRMFMDSPYVEFASFARNEGWSPYSSKEFPSREWVADKKRILGSEEAEKLSEAVFKYRGRWHDDIVKTLDQFPYLASNIATLMSEKQKQIVDIMKQDKKDGVKLKDTYLFNLTFAEIRTMASAAKLVIEAKYKSLLIDQWSPQVADKFAQSRMPTDTMDEEMEDVNPEESWQVSIKGCDNMTAAEMQKMMASYYDPPQAHAIEPEITKQQAAQEAMKDES